MTLTASWLFLAVSLWGAWFTLNAWLPTRRLGFLTIPSFFAGWLTTELAAHHVVWQAVATILFLVAGALDAWPGVLGLVITLASWAGLLGLLRLSGQTTDVMEEALVTGLVDAHPLPRGLQPEPAAPGLANPFKLAHPDVEVVRNIEYAPVGGKRNRLDVYHPRKGATGAPVLFQIHGGGWTVGQKEQQGQPLMQYLATRGWVCVAANYRLSPKATFPDHLIDCKRALHWIRENIAEYGGDPGFVVVTGGSAGGHLSSMVALTAGDPRYQPGFEAADTTVAGCVPFYGVYDFTNTFGTDAHGGMQGFLERAVMKAKLDTDRSLFEDASPMHRVHEAAPPFFVIHGTNDSLAPVEAARKFVSLLRERSREPVVYAELPGAQHAFEVFKSLRTRHVVEGVARFCDHLHARYRARGDGAQSPDAPHAAAG